MRQVVLQNVQSDASSSVETRSFKPAISNKINFDMKLKIQTKSQQTGQKVSPFSKTFIKSHSNNVPKHNIVLSPRSTATDIKRKMLASVDLEKNCPLPFSPLRSQTVPSPRIKPKQSKILENRHRSVDIVSAKENIII